MFIHHSGKANCGRDSTNMSKARVGPERGRHGPNMSSSCMELAFRSAFTTLVETLASDLFCLLQLDQ